MYKQDLATNWERTNKNLEQDNNKKEVISLNDSLEYWQYYKLMLEILVESTLLLITYLQRAIWKYDEYSAIIRIYWNFSLQYDFFFWQFYKLMLEILVESTLLLITYLQRAIWKYDEYSAIIRIYWNFSLQYDFFFDNSISWCLKFWSKALCY